jgi:hypothetical protein
MTSEHFTLISSLGDSPGGNRVMKSTNYTSVGGLVGSTQAGNL